MFYLARTLIPHPQKPGEEIWVAVWDYISSRDLVTLDLSSTGGQGLT